MRKTNRLLAMLLVLVMLFTLAACNTDSQQPATPDITPNITTPTTPDNSNPSQPSDPDDPTKPSDTETVDPGLDNPGDVNLNNLTHELWNGTDAFMVVNGNKPLFTKEEITTKSFETYSDLDKLGRCGVTFACVGRDLMPTEDRGEIGSVKPSGWMYNGKSNNNKYDFVDGKYIYNRCHLIGFQLTGENANEKNLITGTRYLNINGMLAFENMIADAVKEDDLHVMYRVTPIYVGDNLVPEGVLMEGYSVEDEGETIEFCLFSFNVQPGVEINYATGENWLADEKAPADETNPSEPNESDDENKMTYILNTNSKKFHKPDCSAADKISEQNKKQVTCTREELVEDGYDPCGFCKP